MKVECFTKYPLMDITVENWNSLDNIEDFLYWGNIVSSGGWKLLLPWRKNAQLLFDTKASVMTLDEVKIFLIGKLHLLQTTDKKACEGYIPQLGMW